jgi:hypothetical protein
MNHHARAWSVPHIPGMVTLIKMTEEKVIIWTVTQKVRETACEARGMKRTEDKLTDEG